MSARDRSVRIAWALAGGALLAALSLPVAPATASSFLDEVERGRASVKAAGIAKLDSAQARTQAIDDLVARDDPGSAAFQLGAQLEGLDLELDQGPFRSVDRPAVERQVRSVLAAQESIGLGNRAVCLLSGLSDPKQIEKLMRLAAPGWTCSSEAIHQH